MGPDAPILVIDHEAEGKRFVAHLPSLPAEPRSVGQSFLRKQMAGARPAIWVRLSEV